MAERGRRHWSQVKLDEIVGIDLPEDERDLCGKGFINGVAQRGLPTRSAQVIGFADVETMQSDARRIRRALRDGSPLSKRDWQRALVATEIVLASSFYGAAGDWEIVAAGWDDQRTLGTLRRLQRRLAGLRAAPRSREGQ